MTTATRVIAAHLGVIAIWLAIAAILLGIGLMVHRHLLGAPVRNRDGLFAAFWTGIASTLLLLQVWHFAFAINGQALGLVAALGILGLATAAPRPLVHFRPPSRRQAMRMLLFTALSLWLANLSLGPLVAYDTRVYMIPGVEWTKAYPLVPGLGALYGRLAFNSSNVLFAALLESGPWAAAAPHLVGGFFLFILGARIASRIAAGGPNGAPTVLVSTFDLVLLAPLVAMAIDDQLLPSLSADVGVAVAVFAGASLLLGRLVSGPSDETGPGPLIGAVSAFTVALVLKLSAAAFAFFGCAIAFAMLTLGVRARVVRRRVVVATSLLSALLTATWMARGVITSGYPMYPSTVLAAPVEWRVPLEQAQAEAGFVSHFGRTWYSTELANADSVPEYAWRKFHWLRPWLDSLVRGRDHGQVSLPLLCALVFSAGLLVRRDSDGSTSGARLLYVPAAAALLFWFTASPRPAFGISAAWLLAALSIAIVISRFPPPVQSRAAILVVLLLAPIPAAAVVWNSYPADFLTVRAWRWTLARDVDPDDWFREPPSARAATYRTQSGLTLRRPTERSLCGRIPIPCTPTPSPNLRLRVPGHLGAGFVIVGPWQPERWPNSGRFLESWRRTRNK